MLEFLITMSLVAFTKDLLFADEAVLAISGMENIVSGTKLYKTKYLAIAICGAMVDERDAEVFKGVVTIVVNRYETSGRFVVTDSGDRVLGRDQRHIYILSNRDCYLLDNDGLRTLRPQSVYAHGTGAPAFIAMWNAGMDPIDAALNVSRVVASVSPSGYGVRKSELEPLNISKESLGEADIHF